MSTGVVSWSPTAATNATADSSVNWAEGMAPSAVNDSARALMASVAKWRDDLNGSITTAGTSTAYTVTSNEGLALTAGYVVAFVPHTTNGATVTLNVDSLGAKPLRSAPGVELSSGVIIQGTPYAATYYTSNSGEWILHGFYGNPYGLSIGMGTIYLGSTAPNSSFVFPYGQAISRTTYATLFSQVGTSFGSGDGSTTFNIIDLRGRIPVGKDDMGGSAASRVTTAASGIDGLTMGATGGEQAHTLSVTELPAHDHGGTSGSTAANLLLTGVSESTQVPATNNTSLDGGATHIQLSGQAGTSTVTNRAHTHSIPSQGGGGAHNNMPPSVIVPYVLRVI